MSEFTSALREDGLCCGRVTQLPEHWSARSLNMIAQAARLKSDLQQLVLSDLIRRRQQLVNIYPEMSAQSALISLRLPNQLQKLSRCLNQSAQLRQLAHQADQSFNDTQQVWQNQDLRLDVVARQRDRLADYILNAFQAEPILRQTQTNNTQLHQQQQQLAQLQAHTQAMHNELQRCTNSGNRGCAAFQGQEQNLRTQINALQAAIAEQETLANRSLEILSQTLQASPGLLARQANILGLPVVITPQPSLFMNRILSSFNGDLRLSSLRQQISSLSPPLQQGDVTRAKFVIVEALINHPSLFSVLEPQFKQHLGQEVLESERYLNHFCEKNGESLHHFNNLVHTYIQTERGRLSNSAQPERQRRQREIEQSHCYLLSVEPPSPVSHLPAIVGASLLGAGAALSWTPLGPALLGSGAGAAGLGALILGGTVFTVEGIRETNRARRVYQNSYGLAQVDRVTQENLAEAASNYRTAAAWSALDLAAIPIDLASLRQLAASSRRLNQLRRSSGESVRAEAHSVSPSSPASPQPERWTVVATRGMPRESQRRVEEFVQGLSPEERVILEASERPDQFQEHMTRTCGRSQ